MLKYAYQYKEALEKLYVSTIDNPRLRWLNCDGYLGFNLDIKDTTWDRLQYVSVNSNGEILGYLCAFLDLKINSVSSLFVMNFYEPSLCFSKDFYGFLDTLTQRYSKVNWSVVVGNPAEAMYDRVAKRHGGRIVGTKEKHVIIDGALYDFKMYEVMRRNKEQTYEYME